MKIAIPAWGMHVSTVLDFCDRLLIVETESGQIKKRVHIPFSEGTTVGKAARLRDLSVNVLLCGAISISLARMIEAYGISIIPSLSGPVDDILNAYLSGQLFDRNYMLPGHRLTRWPCKGRGMRRHGGRGRIKKGWQT